MSSRLGLAVRMSCLSAALATAVSTDTLAQDEAALTAVSFTAVQADRGRGEYLKSCVDCHGAALDDGEFGGAPLKGATFREKWFGTTADVLFGFLSSAMPPDRPGRLSPQAYADLTAYILSVNGVQPGAVELPADADALAALAVE